MKKTFLAGFAIVAFAFASCNNATNEETTVTKDTFQVADPMSGQVETATVTTTETTTLDDKGNPIGTTYKADGSVDVMAKPTTTGMEIKADAKEAAQTAENDLKKAGNALERGAEKTGNAIERGAQKAGNAIERGAEKTGDALKKGANEVKGEYKDLRDGTNKH